MFIYLIKNKFNNKMYVGQTTNKNPHKRINQHFNPNIKRKYYLHRAIAKYGRDAFEFRIVAQAATQEELDLLEQRFIATLNTLTPNGYNEKTGGRGGSKLTPEKYKDIAKKRASILKGRKFSKEHVAKLSEVRKGFTSPARKKANQATILKRKLNGDFVKIKAINIHTKEEFIFDTIAECSRALGIDPANISKVCRGIERRTQAKGYYFIAEKYGECKVISKRKDHPLRGISKVNKGGYSLSLDGSYIGYRKTLDEILTLKKHYIDNKKLDKKE